MSDDVIAIPLEPVQSSNLTRVGYDAARQILAVEFTHGHLFHYANVPPEVALALYAAESKGKYFAQHVKGNAAYIGLKVTGLCPSCHCLGRHGARCEDCGCADYDREFKIPIDPHREKARRARKGQS